MSETTPAIHQALAAVMDDVKAVAKSERNDSQRFNFRGIDSVVNAVGPALRTHGVVVLPNVLDHRYDTITSRGGSLMGHVTVTVRYDFVGPAGDTLSCTVVGESMDVGDKATPKAMSVAFRIALLQALTLPTDEPDPDSQTYERGDRQAAVAPKATGADDGKVSGLVDEFAAVQTDKDLQRVSDTISALDVGDEMRDILRGAYREALQRVKASTGS